MLILTGSSISTRTQHIVYSIGVQYEGRVWDVVFPATKYQEACENEKSRWIGGV